MSKQRGGMIHTYDLLNEFKKKYEGRNFHFVVGGDILHKIHAWNGGDRLVQEHPFIIFHRKGYELPLDKLPKMHSIV